jgi:RimJ/RimL family protein N-acetyltransferase
LIAPPRGPIEGPRVRLRVPNASDPAVLFEWYTDPERVAPYDRYAGETFEGFRDSMLSAADDPVSLAPRFVVERREGGAPIGCVGYYVAHPVLSVLEVWYLIADPSVRGEGLGSEAVGLLIDFLFRASAVERVGASCDVENLASCRLLEKLGLRREGELRAALHHHGRWHDTAAYGITRSEWSARGAPAGTTPS